MTRVHAAVSAPIFPSTGVRTEAVNPAAKSAPELWNQRIECARPHAFPPTAIVDYGHGYSVRCCSGFTFGRRGDAPRLLVPKGPVAGKIGSNLHSFPAQFLHSRKLPYYPQRNQWYAKVMSLAQDDSV